MRPSLKTATAVAVPMAIGNSAPLLKPNTQPHATTAPMTAAKIALRRHMASRLILSMEPPGPRIAGLTGLQHHRTSMSGVYEPYWIWIPTATTAATAIAVSQSIWTIVAPNAPGVISSSGDIRPRPVLGAPIRGVA